MITGDIPGDEALKSLSPSPGLASPNKERNGKGKEKKKASLVRSATDGAIGAGTSLRHDQALT